MPKFAQVGRVTLAFLLLSATISPVVPEARAQDDQERELPEDLVSLDFRDVPLSQVINALVYRRSVSLIAPPSLTQRVTVKLDRVPWRTALSTILANFGYGYEQTNGILRIDFLTALDKRLTTKNYTLRYMDQEAVNRLLVPLLSKPTNAALSELPARPGEPVQRVFAVNDVSSVHKRIETAIRTFDVVSTATRRGLVQGPDADGRLSVSFENVALSEAMQVLADRLHLSLAWEVPPQGNILLNLRGVDLEALLDLMLLSKNYVYEFDDRVIRIGSRSGFVQRRVTKTFRTKYANALDLRRLISTRLSATGKVEFLVSSYGLSGGGGSFGTSGGAPAGGGGGGGSSSVSRAFIVSDFVTVLRDVERIVRLADVLPRQVSIDVQLIEIELDATQNLGINWNLQAGLTGSSASTPFPLSKPQPFGATGTGTFVFGTTNFQGLTAAFKALTTKNKVHTLSKPTVTTLDGQEANILVGEKFPIITENVNATTGLRTTSLNGTIDIGIQLQVVPQILDPDRIALSIHPTVSSQGPIIQQLAPVVNTREVRTQLMVKQGETAVIGGLMQERTQRDRTGIPGLLHLDLIGHLFGQRNSNVRKNELMVFVTPHILDRPSAPREPERRVIRRLARADGYSVR